MSTRDHSVQAMRDIMMELRHQRPNLRFRAGAITLAAALLVLPLVLDLLREDLSYPAWAMAGIALIAVLGAMSRVVRLERSVAALIGKLLEEDAKC